MHIHIIPTVLSAIIAVILAAPPGTSSSSPSSTVTHRPNEPPKNTIAFPHLVIPGIDSSTAAALQRTVVRPSSRTNDTYDVYVSTGPGTIPGKEAWKGGKLWLGEVICETSLASPTFSEIDGLRAKLSKRPPICWQKNGGGSKCTRLVSHYGGVVSLCGTPSKQVECAAVSWATILIRLICGNSEWGKAGGMYKFALEDEEYNLRAVLH